MRCVSGDTFSYLLNTSTLNLKRSIIIRYIKVISQIKDNLTRLHQLFILIVSIVATVGSLYLSLGLGLYPCQFCWYQRIVMYPLVAIIGYSIYKKELFAPLILSLTTIGILISYYHSYIQRVSDPLQCSSFCAEIQMQIGMLTIPNLSAIAFTLITIGTLSACYLNRDK